MESRVLGRMPIHVPERGVEILDGRFGHPFADAGDEGEHLPFDGVEPFLNRIIVVFHPVLVVPVPLVEAHVVGEAAHPAPLGEDVRLEVIDLQPGLERALHQSSLLPSPRRSWLVLYLRRPYRRHE